MTILCPHCNADVDITGKQPGDCVWHYRCGRWLFVARHPTGERYGVKVSGPKVIRYSREIDRGG